MATWQYLFRMLWICHVRCSRNSLSPFWVYDLDNRCQGFWYHQHTLRSIKQCYFQVSGQYILVSSTYLKVQTQSKHAVDLYDWQNIDQGQLNIVRTWLWQLTGAYWRCWTECRVGVWCLVLAQCWRYGLRLNDALFCLMMYTVHCQTPPRFHSHIAMCECWWILPDAPSVCTEKLHSLHPVDQIW